MRQAQRPRKSTAELIKIRLASLSSRLQQGRINLKQSVWLR
jgi:hypothetical protein